MAMNASHTLERTIVHPNFVGEDHHPLTRRWQAIGSQAVVATAIGRRTPFWGRRAVRGFMLLMLISFRLDAGAETSTCYGTTSRGALKNACQLPSTGSNFRPYSDLGIRLGRTYVHCAVAEVVESAYQSLAASHPAKVFVYGETGFEAGGQFRPHKTHQNGLSIDFMVPVINQPGESVSLPTGPANKFGYSLEFDSDGVLGELTIDFEAIVAHLTALKAAAAESGIGIWRVIFDPELQPRLRELPAWSGIADLKFSARRSWVRHDEHYHVDFAVPCKALE